MVCNEPVHADCAFMIVFQEGWSVMNQSGRDSGLLQHLDQQNSLQLLVKYQVWVDLI